MSGQKVEIGYWKIRGLAAPLRMMCEFSEVEYNNKMYDVTGDEKAWDLSEWTSVKPGLKKRNALMNLPYVIDTDGFVVTQSLSCLSYLGRKYDLFGSNNKEMSMVEQILSEVRDLRDTAVGIFYGKQWESLGNFIKGTVPKTYAKFEGWLEAQATGPYTVGDKPTAGDFYLWEMLDQCELLAVDLEEPSPLKAYPRLRKLYDAMRAEPTLQRYFSGPLHNLQVNNHMAIWGYKPRSIGELYYFNLRARGEPLRFLMRYAKIPYTDRTIAGEDWPELKKTVPNGYMPVIKLPSGQFKGESRDIAQFIATRAGPPLMPVKKEQQDAAARIFRICNTEPIAHCMGLTMHCLAKDAEPKIPGVIAEMLKVLKSLEAELVGSGGAFMGGKEPHYGEFALFNVMNFFLTLSRPSPTLPDAWKKWYSNMCVLPGVKEYLEERPQAMSGKCGLPGSRIEVLELDS